MKEIHLTIIIVFRDLRETRQICESIGGELKRKDSQIKELQARLETNEGCKYTRCGFVFGFCHFI